MHSRSPLRDIPRLRTCSVQTPTAVESVRGNLHRLRLQFQRLEQSPGLRWHLIFSFSVGIDVFHEDSSCPSADFGQQIDFDFCKPTVQPSADTRSSAKQPLRPRPRACAKLLVRSGLRCGTCFRIKSACTCLQTKLLLPSIWPQPLSDFASCLRWPRPNFRWARPHGFCSVSLSCDSMHPIPRPLHPALPPQVSPRWWVRTSGSSHQKKRQPRRPVA